MRHIRTKLGTGEKAESSGSILEKLLKRIESNPDYDLKIVHEWFIEFDDDDWPGREIGLDLDGDPVLAGPDDNNYGFWLDTNMRYNDFDGIQITANQFEEKWNHWFASQTKDAKD